VQSKPRNVRVNLKGEPRCPETFISRTLPGFWPAPERRSMALPYRHSRLHGNPDDWLEGT
ncbi:MAG: hypothetical protein MK125_06375, partial [Dehalococcoidia bacterium]|nr:hypothetical protein [Dehalococcoidia bacterium]